jgi:hypothetical protein
MKLILDRYLDRVLLVANKTGAEAESIRRELRDHLLQKTQDLIAAGTPPQEATMEALRQHGSPRDIGYRLRGAFPWIDIRSRGTARGVIAIGPRAIGIFAFGGAAIGVVAVGGAALGIVSLGGAVIGLALAWGGFGMGGIVSAGFAVGIVAMGGFALGIVAEGGFAAGVIADGGLVIGHWVPHAAAHLGASSPEPVPPLLNGLRDLLPICRFWNTYLVVIFPLYLGLCFWLGWLQRREGWRIESEKDWLIDG